MRFLFLTLCKIQILYYCISVNNTVIQCICVYSKKALLGCTQKTDDKFNSDNKKTLLFTFFGSIRVPSGIFHASFKGRANKAQTWGGSRGGPVEPPKLNVKTYNKHVVKKKLTNYITTVVSTKMEVTLEQIAPENAGNCISEALKLQIFRGSTPPDPPRAYRLRRAFIRTPLPQILDPPQTNHTQDTSHHLGVLYKFSNKLYRVASNLKTNLNHKSSDLKS